MAYLAVEASRPHRRESLDSLLWPDQPDDKARANLRQTLSRLNRTLQETDDSSSFLFITPETVQFNLNSIHDLDVRTFEALLQACQSHAHRRIETCKPCGQRLSQAVNLYRGNFLEGFLIPESNVFEDWLVLKRETLRQQAIMAHHTLAAYHLRRGEYEQALVHARQQLVWEPWREEAHRQLMQALALNGQRSAALAQYETCRRLLDKELGAEPDDETRALRDQIMRGLADTPAPLNLPAQTTPFIGREAELQQIEERLANPQCRLLTLVGPGGVGKTRLTIRAAAAQMGAFRDGIYFVDLSSLQSASHIATAIAAAMRLPLPDDKPAQDELFADLRRKELLLILDNLEHLIGGGEADAAAFVARLLRAAPGVVCLATSRVPLNLQAEWRMPLEGLPYPAAQPADIARRLPAIQLFEERAQRTVPAFLLDPETLPAVIRICQLLEGLPLGIKMAAAWVRANSCAQIAQQIEHDLDFLATSAGDIPERQRSLRVVFERSWQLLTSDEKRAMCQLSVWRGHFSREAAEAVMEKGQESELQAAKASELHAAKASEITQLLTSLVDNSLLQFTALGGYTWHPLVQKFAQEQLAEQPDEERAVWARAVAHATRVGDAAAQVFDNVEAWNQYSIALDCLAHLPPDDAQQRQWVDLLLKEARVGFFKENPRAWLPVLAEAEKTLNALGGRQPPITVGGQPPVAADRQRLAYIYVWMGRAHRHLDARSEAIRYYERVQTIALELNNAELFALPLRSLGQILHAQGRCGEAVRTLRQAVVALATPADRLEWILAELDLSWALALNGLVPEAWQHVQRALDFAESKQDLSGLGQAHFRCASIALHGGDSQRARAEAQQAIQFAEQAQMGQVLAGATLYQAWAESRLGQHEAARQSLAQIYHLIVEQLDSAIYARDWGLAVSAEIALNAGRLDEALQGARRAADLAERSEGLYAGGLAQRVWGEALARLSPPRPVEAARHFAESLRQFEEGEARLEVARTHIAWGALGRAAAREHWPKAAQQFEALGANRELEQIRNRLAELSPA
ncbi:MAG: AAA family ATPase [Chloroflexi bacterium]|nr:AAA family ATPase [Chloroflexota bacterium]